MTMVVVMIMTMMMMIKMMEAEESNVAGTCKWAGYEEGYTDLAPSSEDS